MFISAASRPHLQRPFVFHQPLIGKGSSSYSLDNTLRSSGAPTSLTTSSALSSDAKGGSTTGAEIPWSEVVSSIISEPKERAAALIMLHRCPLLGTAVACSVTVHHDKVLEITLASHRTGILPLDPSTESYARDTLDHQQRRRVVIPVSAIASIGCDLPQRSTSPPPSLLGGDGDVFDLSGDDSAPQYGHEIIGSPVRAMRITLHIHHDPAQRPSDWFNVDSTSPSGGQRSALRPRHVVLYATSQNDAHQWREYFRRICQGNLTEALGRATWKRLMGATHSGNATQQPGSTGREQDDAENDRLTGEGTPMVDGHTRSVESLLLDESSTPTLEFHQWHTSRHLSGAGQPNHARWERSSPSCQRTMVRLRDCTGYGVWCPYGHKWLTEVQPEVRLRALERIKATTMSLTEEIDAQTMIPDVAPWIVLQRPSGGEFHPCVNHSQSMRRDIMWRLSCLRHHRSAPDRQNNVNTTPDDAEDCERLSWLDARARFMSPTHYERFTAQKYLDVEEALGGIIDSLADKLSAATGIHF